MSSQNLNGRLLLVTSVLAALALGVALAELMPPHTRAAPLVYLRVNQVGYVPNESKLAFALTNENLGGQSFNVIRAADASVVLTTTVGSDRGNYGHFAHLYELIFSGLTTSGTYSLRVGSDTSPNFSIGENAYSSVLSPTLQFFRVQRCGNTSPLLHGVCHLTDGIVANGTLSGTHVNATGGWHDAGDYLKFATATGFATALMLHAYQRRPDVFADANYNNVPDVLDEARVGLDWLLKMWDPANQVLYYQVGDYRDHQYGWRMPEGDDVAYPNRPVWACEAGKGANVAGKAAAAFALAASLWNDPSRTFYDPVLAAKYLAAAKQIYGYGQARPAAQPGTAGLPPEDVYYAETSWADDMALAAAELYRATGNPMYLSDARSYAMAVGSAGLFDWSDVSALAHYEIARLDPTYAVTATIFLRQDLSIYQSNLNANRFRAAVSQFYWGSAEDMVGAALTALWYEDLSGDNAYRPIALAQRDYVLGANPWGVAFVNSIGTTWPHHPHHQVAALTSSELVGFWDEGPVSLAEFQAQGITLTTPDAYSAFQSNEAVYHDNVEDYVTNEPTISMNAVGIALTAWYAPPFSAITSTVYLPIVKR